MEHTNKLIEAIEDISNDNVVDITTMADWEIEVWMATEADRRSYKAETHINAKPGRPVAPQR